MDNGVLSRLRNFWNLGSLYNEPAVAREHSRNIITAAARVRIHTSEIRGLSWASLIGRRNSLKLAIVTALDQAGRLPKRGLIEIRGLYLIKEREIAGYDLRRFHLDKPILKQGAEPIFELPMFKVRFIDQAIVIRGFNYQLREFMLAKPFVIDLR